MSAEVCPRTRLRCNTADKCRSSSCAWNKNAHPMHERNLTKAEKYALTMDEKRLAKIREGTEK